MKRVKVISKSASIEILKNGGYLNYDYSCAKVSIYDKNSNFIGRVQYNTYCDLVRICEQKKTKTEYGLYGYENRWFLNENKENENLDILIKFIPDINKLDNEQLYIIMDLIKKEISRRNK